MTLDHLNNILSKSNTGVTNYGHNGQITRCKLDLFPPWFNLIFYRFCRLNMKVTERNKHYITKYEYSSGLC